MVPRMLHNKTIAVVVPCYNEETQIGKVLSTMPDYVDLIIVVDDLSKDRTCEVVEQFIADGGATNRTVLVRHLVNGGVGKSIVDGYQECVRRGIDVAAVMAGDAQMDPRQLRSIVHAGGTRQDGLCQGQPVVLQACLEHGPLGSVTWATHSCRC